MKYIVTEVMVPGGFYEFPNTVALATMSKQHTLQAIVTGTSVLALKFNRGIAIGLDKLCSYGSLACYRDISHLLQVNECTVMGA